MKYHIVIVISSNSTDVERLRVFINNGKYNYISMCVIGRAFWKSTDKIPYHSLGIGCKTKKDEFHLRLKFKTVSGDWLQKLWLTE